jgi:CSLREA domain-containing protein
MRKNPKSRDWGTSRRIDDQLALRLFAKRTLLRALGVLAVVAFAAVVLALATAPVTPTSAGTFTVRSIGDDPDAMPGDGVCATAGAVCTLRAAIQEANALAGADTINFSIPPSGAKTISPLSALPGITEAVTIDGTTQPGFAGSPIIELNGAGAGASVNGIAVTGGTGSAIKGLVINNFNASGILLQSASGANIVQGNYVGTNLAGTADLGNGGNGVSVINGSPNNLIGGTAAGTRNVISANSGSGVYIAGVSSTGNTISGNYIGTTADGTAALGNPNGVFIDGAPSNTVGGLATTTGGPPGNVVSGNTEGIVISSDAADGNVVQGNLIGTKADGAGGLANTDVGVWIINGADNSLVGGSVDTARNVISANNRGVAVFDAGTTLTAVRGNYIGTDITGGAALGNSNGITLAYGSSGSTIGGTNASERNLISGNTDGIVLGEAGTASNGNSIVGNYIGTNVAGTADLGNTTYGVLLNSGAQNNTVGGTSAGAGNVVSGNNVNGIHIKDVSTTGNFVQGNLVGTNAAGTAAIGNSFRGIQVESPSNTIGGTTSGAGNVVSGNGDRGIAFEGATTTGNVAQGNYVGVGVDGATPIGNSFQGIWIASSASGQTIGGPAAGAGNVVAQNGAHGIGILTSGNLIQGNTVRNNGSDGIYVDSGPNTIGGTSSGAGNVITANAGDGVFVNSGTGNSIRGNSIYSNTGLGIDLSPDGVTPNDPGDGDTGPNNLMNFPVITAGNYDGVQTTVSGTLDTSSPATATVDVYSTDAADPSGNGEGRAYLGSATPNGGGAWTLVFSGAQPYTRLTATATDSGGSTSEFSTTFTPALGAGMPLTAIARQGQATPIGGTFSILGFAQVPSSSGNVVFWAFVSGGTATEGIFSGSGGPITKLVAAGDATPIGGTFSNFGVVPVVNNSNDVVFWATVNGGRAAEGIFVRSSGGVISKLVATGDAAPGGGTFTSFQSFAGTPIPVTNNLGDVSFWATRSVGGEGVFLYSGGTVSKVASVGDSAPGGGTFTTFVSGAGYATIPIVADSKQVTFRAFLTGGPSQGVYLFDGGTLTKVAAAGDSSPIGGSYTSFGRAPVPNESGQVTFFAAMSGSSAATCTSQSAPCAVFRRTAAATRSGAVITKLLAGGDPGPIGVGGTINDIASGPIMNDSGQVTVWTGIANGLASQSILRITNPVESVAAVGNSTPIGGTFSSFIEPVSGFPATSIVNNQGQVAFWGAVSGGSGTAGIFITQAPPSQPLITAGPVAGAAAPGTNGGTFGANFDLDINASGRAVFANTVTGGTSNAGVFLFFAGSPVQDISLQGEAAPGGGAYNNFFPPVNNDGNTIVGHATTSGGPGEGLYLFFAGSPDQSVVLKGDPLPSPASGTYNAFGDPAINNVGQIAANANTGLSTEGLFLFFAGQPVSSSKVQALKNDVAPNSGGQTFLFFAGSPSIASDQYGRITQRITLNGGGEGLYLFFAGQPVSTAQKLVRNGDPVPGGGTFLFFAGSPAINSDGTVVAVADYNDGVQKTGLFLFFAGQPGVPSTQPPIKLADLTTSPPAGVGGTFTGFSNPTLTNGLSPEVVARGTISGGTASEGLFLFFAGTPVQTVVKQGDQVPTAYPSDTFAGGPPIFPFHAMNNGVQVVFVGNIAGNPDTTQGVFIASLDSDSDGILDFLDNCPTLTNTDQRNTDASLAAAGANVVGDALGNACDPDDDNDGFSDVVESSAGTNPLDNCTSGPGTGGDSWPADINNDTFVDVIGDISKVTGEFGKAVGPPPGAPARYDIAPDPPDGFIDVINDIVRLTGLFGQSCR